MVSAATGMPARPRRLATSPSWQRRRGPGQGPAAAARRCSRRWRRTASRAAAPGCRAPGVSACQKADAAGLVQLGHLGQASPLRPRVRAPSGNAGAVELLGAVAPASRPGRARRAPDRYRAGTTRLVTPPATAAASLGLERALVFVAGSRRRAARSIRPGATTQPRGVDRALGRRSRRARCRCRRSGRRRWPGRAGLVEAGWPGRSRGRS